MNFKTFVIIGNLGINLAIDYILVNSLVIFGRSWHTNTFIVLYARLSIV